MSETAVREALEKIDAAAKVAREEVERLDLRRKTLVTVLDKQFGKSLSGAPF